MDYKKIKLKRGKEESLKRLHPWVFSGAIDSMENGIDEGDIVAVYTSKDEYIGVGHYQIGSITVRMLSFGNETINEDFYIKRLSAALHVRTSLHLITPNNNTFRLVHGEGDYLPGLIIDVYDNTAVMQAHAPGMHFARKTIAEALTKVKGLNVKNIYYKSETTLPYKAQLDAENEYLIGGNETNIALENGLKFHVDWLKGQKTGFFVDQRENRALVEQYAKNRKVLNMFCYTGGFSVYAMRGGAELVHSVDSSAKAIQLTDENIALNFGEDNRHKSFAEDAFKYLNEIDGKYDFIILDPPAFAKHRKVLKNALIGYRKLNAKAFEKIQPGGILFTFSCSQIVTKEQFRLAVFSAAAQTGRKVRILHQLTQPADHPINIYHPEGEYLKGLVLYVE